MVDPSVSSSNLDRLVSDMPLLIRNAENEKSRWFKDKYANFYLYFREFRDDDLVVTSLIES